MMKSNWSEGLFWVCGGFCVGGISYLVFHKLTHHTKKPIKVIEKLNQPKMKVTIRVPATTSNFGPGFDTVGMALDLWSEFTIERSQKFEVICEGEGSKELPLDESNLFCQSVKHVFDLLNEPLPILKYHCLNRIPCARGLGSSSTAVVGGLMAAYALLGREDEGQGKLLQLASSLEGHPDNVCPAIYGGIQLGVKLNDGVWKSSRIPLPQGMKTVLLIPDFYGKTSELRNCLPKSISIPDATYNISRVAFLIDALHTEKWENLEFATQDALHQPPRAAKVYSYLDDVIKSSIKAGAYACFLSGSGPSVLALTSTKKNNDKEIGDAMLNTAKLFKLNSVIKYISPTEKGAHVSFAQ
eukprot:c11311_g2_i1.p1 GENE.c11311_g2_i1~~c11311_g2_i1.p1  ORF type:complete len:355 (+),score=116.26 c11311_g2_i1:3-1067(+)